MNLKQGTLLQGKEYRYRIVRVLGQGTFGVTYLATTKVMVEGPLGALDTTLQVAIKEFFMRDINGRDENTVTCGSQSRIYEEYKHKFAREAQNLSRLHHSHIVRVLEQFDANNTYYYVMEYCEGGSLDALITSQGRLDEKNSIGYLRQIGEALSYMHGQKMLHLDLKPGNIMLRNDTDAVLIDFGLAKQYNAEGEAETSTKVGLGTPGYAPIEQADWKGKGFPVTMDVYAMGATLYKMLVGVRPPDASHILNNPDCLVEELTQQGVSRQLVVVISKAMAPLVKDRFTSVDEVLAALDGENTMLDTQQNDQKKEATSLEIDKEKGRFVEKAEQEAMNAFKIMEKDFEAAHTEIEHLIAIRGGGVDKFARLRNVKDLLGQQLTALYRWKELYGEKSSDMVARWIALHNRILRQQSNVASKERWYRTLLENISKSSGTWEKHDYVDLGLSVMWATHDMGAKSFQNLGWHYAWGENHPKLGLDTLDNYGWKVRYRTGFLKLKKKWECMEIGSNSNISGDTFHDAAARGWGAGWRMPTKEEWQELIEKCMWFLMTDKGYEGWAVVGPNGNSIFLPISKEDICYWSANSEVNTNDAYVCGMFTQVEKRFLIYRAERFSGHRVRPVINKQSIVREEKVSNPVSLTNNINGHEYVDLGLSVKWATCNVGASSPSDYGNYYAWGETGTKNDYSKSTYKYYENDNFVNIGQNISGTRYDAARAHWGGTWRLPTKEELQELSEKCIWTWTSQGGRNGYRVTGKNGKSIFLPANSTAARKYGYYWSGTLTQNEGGSAFGFYIYDGNHGLIRFTRNSVLTVRPVTE